MESLPSMHKICRLLPDKHVRSEPEGFVGIYPIAIKPKLKEKKDSEVFVTVIHLGILKTEKN